MLTERTLHVCELSAGQKRTLLADVTPEQTNGLPVKDICSDCAGKLIAPRLPSTRAPFIVTKLIAVYLTHARTSGIAKMLTSDAFKRAFVPLIVPYAARHERM